jgi:phytoene synthase
MTSRPDRAALVAFARDSIARGSKSFAMASRLFDRATRERAWLLYAWCRAADDIADGQEMGHGMSAVANPRAQLALIKSRSEDALAGRPTGLPAFDALGLVAAEASIPACYPNDVIDGFALDSIGFRPRTEQELYRYCYHVAGAVGCMMAIVMGVPVDDDATLNRACDLGIAFQLANIARDIAEDGAAGRCYLPRDWLAEMDIPEDKLLNPEYRSRLAVLAARLAERAGRYEASARYGAAALPFRSAWAVLAAAGIYGDIARAVKRLGASAWDNRVTTSRADKLGWAILAAVQARSRASYPDPGRDGLWSQATLRSTAR